MSFFSSKVTIWHISPSQRSRNSQIHQKGSQELICPVAVARSRSWLCLSSGWKGGHLTIQAVLTSLHWSNSGNPSRTPLWSNSGKEKLIREKPRLTCLRLFLPQALLICLLCFSGDNAGQAPSRDPEKASGSRKDHLQVLRTTYLNDVKKTLDKSTFSHFYEALLTYKKTDDYDAMIPVIAALTTERPEDFHLLRSKGYFKAIII